MAKKWAKVQKILSRCLDEVKREVVAIANSIHKTKGDELQSLANELNVNMFLAVESHEENPVLVMPVLYVQPKESLPLASYQQRLMDVIKVIEEKIGGWADDYRLSIRGLPQGGETNLTTLIAQYG